MHGAMPEGGKLFIETKPCDLDEQYAATHSEATSGSLVRIGVTDSGIDKEPLTDFRTILYDEGRRVCRSQNLSRDPPRLNQPSE